MSESDDYRRDVAGRFSQAARNKTFNLTHRLFPQFAEQITEDVSREVEEQGLQVEGIEVILNWFRSDADAKWLDDFWQSTEGGRFMELTVELFMRAQLRRLNPEMELPPPGT